jgi:hypothetical protein
VNDYEIPSAFSPDFVPCPRRLQSMPTPKPSIKINSQIALLEDYKMAILIPLTTEKPGTDHDEAFNSEMLVLNKNLGRWSIPYTLPVTLNHEPAMESVVIRRSFLT